MIKRKSAKPLIIILTVLSLIAVLAIAASIVLQSIWDFIGINGTNKIAIDTACAVTYINTKYSIANTNRQIFVTFVAICLAFILTALLVAFFVMFVCYYCFDKEKTQEDYMTVVTQYKMYIVHVILWWDLLSLSCNVAYFLSFYLQIPVSCNGTVQLQTQQIVLFALSGIALILLLLVWIIVIRMNSHVKQYLADNQIVAPHYKTKNKQTEKQLITDVQMEEKAYLAQARKKIQGNNVRNQSINEYFNRFPNTKNQDKYPSPQQKRSILHEMQKQQIKKQQQRRLRSPLLDKYTKQSPKNQGLKSQFYYGNFKQLNQRKSPQGNEENLIFHKPRFDQPQTPQKNGRGNQYLEDYQNSSKGKLQTSYFRQPTLKNRQYQSPPFERESKLFRKPEQPVQQQYYDTSKRPSLYFPTNKTGESRYSPIQRQKQSPKNSSYARKIDFDQRKNSPLNPMDRMQRSPNTRGRQNSQKQRKGMLIDYIRGRYVD